MSQGGVSITMSLTSGTGTLSGTLAQLTNAAGLGIFNDLSIDLIGSKQLTASSAGLTSSVSNTFLITDWVAAIPTLGSWGLIGLSLLILAVGTFTLWRREIGG